MIFKVLGGVKEHGVVVGNTYDKYGSTNIFVKIIMKNFKDTLSHFVDIAAPNTIHEVGCGEGFWVLKWNKVGLNARGSDFSDKAIGIAEENASKAALSTALFNVRSIYDLDLNEDWAELVVCCEVLEHLEYPKLALEKLREITGSYLIVSVPREPVWRLLNILRGKYLASYGNTPGHIQHWTKKDFIELVSLNFEIIEVKNPLPWTMLLCRPRKF